MPHDVSLVTTVAAAFGLAFILGFIAVKLKLPALIGYLFAGIIIGPGTPGFVANMEMAGQLAEIGVMLLMFGVGLHFSWEDLLAVKRIAIPGAIVQMVVATTLGFGLASLWGWSLGGALVFGLSLSVASTVVLLKALESRGMLKSINGQIAVGWLVVEDLATVMVLVLLPPLAGWLGGKTVSAHNIGETILTTFGLVSAFVALMLVVGRRIFPWILWQVTKTGSRELFTLCVIAAAISIAYAAALLFGVSFALGSFFAGMVMRKSAQSKRAAEQSLPLRDAFAVLFFVSVGMLFQPMIIINEPFQLLGVIGIILFGKTLAAFVLVLIFRYPLSTALTVSAGLAQIGEFSFILASLGISLGLLPVEGQSLILAGALISIAVNPLLFKGVEPIAGFIIKHSSLIQRWTSRDDKLTELPNTVSEEVLVGQVVLVGYGRVGHRIGKALLAHDIPFVVAEENREIIKKLRKDGIPAVYGNASEAGVLIQAHIVKAGILVIATPNTLQARKMVEIATKLNPKIKIVLRTHSDEEVDFLEKEKVDKIFMGENELATGMTGYILNALKAKKD